MKRRSDFTAQLEPTLRFLEFTGDWQEKRLGEVFDYQQPTPYLVRSTEYKDIYKTPVLTAGKTFILGYTDETEGVYTDLPVTLFDDFTTAVQWVDFPFKVKSSAVKILKTKAEYNPKIAHELLSKVQFKAENHQRHWISIYQNLSVYTPSLPEQQKIAAFLAAVDKRVALLERKVQQLEAYKRGVMQQLFSQQLRFTRPDGSHFPAWQEKRLGEIGEIITGKTPATSNRSLWGGTIDFITPSDIDDGKYQKPTERTLAEISNLRVLPPGSISFTCIASIGKMSITKRPSVTNQQINSIITRQCIDNEYLYYCLLNMTPRIRATQANTTLPIINKAEFSGFKVRVPCMAEQQKIATFLSALDEKIALTRQQLDKTKQFKKGLLQRMFV